MKNFSNPIIAGILSVIFGAILAMGLAGCSSAPSSLPPDQNSPETKTNNVSAFPQQGNTKTLDTAFQQGNSQTDGNNDLSANGSEDTVVINVNNMGRSNPFKPYQEKSLLVGNNIQIKVPNIHIPSNAAKIPTINVPKPPTFNPDSSVSTLLKIKVSGILYDPAGSSAIINVDNNDYMVHKGDFIFDFYVKNITANKVTIKTGNNVYSAGIGEVIEGDVNEDPVLRSSSSFADRSIKNRSRNYSRSYSTDIKIISPTTLPSIN